jgi:hypothetical protein
MPTTSGVHNMRLPATYLLLSLLVTEVATSADQKTPQESIATDIAPVVAAFEDALQGRDHPPLADFIAKEAKSERGLLREELSQPARKPLALPAASKLYWAKLMDADAEAFRRMLPNGVDADSAVLVFRNTDSKGDESFRVVYCLSKVEGRWKVVGAADGWMANEPLASASSPLAVGNPPK